MTSPNPTRRQYPIASGAALFGATGATGAASASHTDPAKTAPLPSDPDAFSYGTMGDADAPVVSVLGNFKCPYTQEFMLGNLNDVVEEYVETGDLRLRFRSLAYEPYPDDPSHGSATYFISSSDPRIARVALGVWNADPTDYWRFNVSLFQDQPSGWVSYDDLRARLRDAGVENRDRIIDLARSDRYEDELRATTDLFADLEVPWTPHLEMNGEILSGPQYDEGRLFDWLDARIAEADTTTTSSTDTGDSETSVAADGVEVGSTTMNQRDPDAVRRVSLGSSYDAPVAIAKPASFNNPYPVHARLHGVGADVFDLALEEWEYQNGTHPTERISHVVADKSLDSLGGLAAEVGEVYTDHQFSDVTFDRDFDRTPVVLAQSQTYRGPDPITVRLRDVTADGMSVRVQEVEQGSPWHTAETVGYVAVEPGSGTIDGRPFEVGFASDGIDNVWHHVDFDGSYDDPAFVATVQSYEGWNPMAIRYRDLDADGVDIFLQEDRSADREIWHAEERVGYFVSEG